MIRRILTGKKPPGSSWRFLPWLLRIRKSHFLSKVDTQERLLLIANIAKTLHQKSNTFEDKKLSTQLAKINEDLNQMVADF